MARKFLASKNKVRTFKYKLGRMTLVINLGQNGAIKWQRSTVYFRGKKVFSSLNKRGWLYNIPSWNQYAARRWPKMYYPLIKKVHKFKLGRMDLVITQFARGPQKWQVSEVFFRGKKVFSGLNKRGL